MITAISSSKEKSLSINKNNYTKQYIDTPINPASLNRIAFKGNLTKVGKNLLGDVGNNLGKKIMRLSEESLDSIKTIIRKITKENDLPFTTKSIVAATAGDESIISKALKLLADPQVPESNKSVIRDKLAELRVMQKTPQNLTPNSATNLDLANMKAEWAKNDVIKLAGDSEAAIEKAGHSVGYGDVDPKTGKLTYGGQQKVNHPNKSLHHHDDFDNNPDNLTNNHHSTTSFRGDGATAFDPVSDTHSLGTDLTSGKPDLKGLGNSAWADSTNAFEGLSEMAGRHDALAGALDGITNLTDHLDNPILQGTLAEVLPGTKFLKPGKDLIDGKIEKAVVGTSTRLTEIVIAPVKLAWAGLGGIAGSISRLAGNKGKGTGFFGGVNAASRMWGKGREVVEDFILDETKADPLALAKKQREAYEQGTNQIVNDIKKKGDENVSKITEAYRPHIDNAQKAANRANQTTQMAAKETVFYQEQSKVVEGQLEVITKAIDVRLQKLQEAQKQMAENHKTLIDDLSKKLEEAKMQHNTKLQEELNLKLEEMQKAQKAEMNEITKDIKALMQSSSIFEKIHNKANVKGFGRIAGYQEQINTLLDHFGAPIALERIGKTADVPGGILFFGPQGNGKTTFAEAFAGQLGCRLIKISPELNAKTNWNNLEKVAKQAQELFQQDGTRTVILINEFDNFASNDSKNGLKKVLDAISPAGVGDINVKLKKFIEECSKKYHCTVFATTNFPERISSELLGSGEFYKAGLPPANIADASAVLRHYAEDFAEAGINYDELAEQILKNQPNEAFSNSKIKSVVMDLIKADKNKTRKITQEELRKSIESKGADISKQDLELFNKQLEHVGKLSKKKSS